MRINPIPFAYFLGIVYDTEDFTGIVINHIMDQYLVCLDYYTQRHELLLSQGSLFRWENVEAKSILLQKG